MITVLLPLCNTPLHLHSIVSTKAGGKLNEAVRLKIFLLHYQSFELLFCMFTLKVESSHEAIFVVTGRMYRGLSL